MKRLVTAALLALISACGSLPAAQDCYPGASPECRGLHRG
jgi:hypothetical protein